MYCSNKYFMNDVALFLHVFKSKLQICSNHSIGTHKMHLLFYDSLSYMTKGTPHQRVLISGGTKCSWQPAYPRNEYVVQSGLASSSMIWMMGQVCTQPQPQEERLVHHRIMLPSGGTSLNRLEVTVNSKFATI